MPKKVEGQEEEKLSFPIYLYKDLVDHILSAKGEVKLSLDLGIHVKTYEAQSLKRAIGEEILKKVKDNTVHVYDGKELFKLATFTDGYYALKMIKGEPVLEINGIRMHVFSASGVFTYAKKIVEWLKVKRGERILETCFGQGYITRELVKKGANVVGFEISPAVLDIAEWNPYSKELFTNPNVVIKNEDVVEGIKKLKRQTFDKIVHDPPSMRTSPYLYSRPFYRELYRVAKKHTLLYHYIGSFGKKKGKNIKEVVEQRLEEVGWKVIAYNEALQAVLARKSEIGKRKK